MTLYDKQDYLTAVASRKHCRLSWLTKELPADTLLKRYLMSIALILLLNGCGIITPYHAPLDQGEKLSSAALSQVKPGMDKAQVKYLLGTPNVIDPFDSHTWYYMHTYKITSMPATQDQFIAHFDKNDKLIHISGNYSSPSKLKYTTYHTK